MTPLLMTRDLRKSYIGGDHHPVDVLSGVDLVVDRGEFVAIVGTSGAGKSTLLHLLGALDRPTSGEVSLDGVQYSALPERGLDEIRSRRLGFVFQFHHLLREFSALENVMWPLLIRGMESREARARAETMLDRVGLTPRATHRPHELSGGEQQRCAVARAVVGEPALLLADEPSGNLDHANSHRLHDLLVGVVRETETAAVVVTHNRHLADRADRVLLLDDGRLQAATATEAMP
ncbi:MAG: ABC transporter ATP-binding protein [Gemmatimonadales bacterium]